MPGSGLSRFEIVIMVMLSCMVLACWWSVSAAVGSLFLGRAAAMQGEHCYVLTSLLIVYAGQHAAFKDEIGAI